MKYRHAHLLHGQPEGLDVGAMEARLDAPPDCSAVRSARIPRFEGSWLETGGIRPPQRRRSRSALTLAEREEISRAVVEGQSIRSIAARLGRAPSTVSREIKRNGGQAAIGPAEADQAAWDRALRPKRCKLAENRALARIVADKLRLLWSPEQIAGWLKHTYPRDESHQRVTRDHLPQPLHPGAWRLEEGAAAALEAHARHASLSPSHAEDRHPRADRRRRVDQRAPCVRRRSGGAWSLGRRPAVRQLATARSPRWLSAKRAT